MLSHKDSKKMWKDAHFSKKPALLLVSHLCDSSITQNSLRFARPETWKTSLLILHPQDLSSHPTTSMFRIYPVFSFTTELVQAPDYTNSLQTGLFLLLVSLKSIFWNDYF